jgi:Spy/CpxP family protein refolding chaperone
MKRFRSLTLTAVLAVVLAGAAYAQGPGPGGRGRGADGFGRGGGLPLRALNLTDAQEQQIRTATQQNRQQNRALFERVRTAMEAQRKAASTIPVNEALIRSTTQELVDAQTDAAIQQARLQTEIFNMLTPEQQAEAKKLQAERETRQAQRQQQRPRN